MSSTYNFIQVLALRQENGIIYVYLLPCQGTLSYLFQSMGYFKAVPKLCVRDEEVRLCGLKA